MIVTKYTKADLPNIILNLEPDLIIGCEVGMLTEDKNDSTAYVLVLDGAYEGLKVWMLRDSLTV